MIDQEGGHDQERPAQARNASYQKTSWHNDGDGVGVPTPPGSTIRPRPPTSLRRRRSHDCVVRSRGVSGLGRRRGEAPSAPRGSPEKLWRVYVCYNARAFLHRLVDAQLVARTLSNSRRISARSAMEFRPNVVKPQSSRIFSSRSGGKCARIALPIDVTWIGNSFRLFTPVRLAKCRRFSEGDRCRCSATLETKNPQS